MLFHAGPQHWNSLPLEIWYQTTDTLKTETQKFLCRQIFGWDFGLPLRHWLPGHDKNYYRYLTYAIARFNDACHFFIYWSIYYVSPQVTSRACDYLSSIWTGRLAHPYMSFVLNNKRIIYTSLKNVHLSAINRFEEKSEYRDIGCIESNNSVW